MTNPLKNRKEVKVMIGVPSRNNSWWSDFGLSLAAMCMATAYEAPFISVILNNTVGTGLAMNRIKLCRQAIDRGCDYILFLDDDMRIPMHTLMMFVMRDKDVIAANCARKELPPRSTAKGFDNMCLWTTNQSTGVEEVKSVGTAVMLVKLDTLKKLPAPWFCEDPVLEIGEDVYFCNKMRDHGYKVWIDHDVSKDVVHMGGFEFTHQIMETWDRKKENAA